MVRDAVASGKAILDAIHQKKFIEIFDEMNLGGELFVIVIYTSLPNLVRNLESRRKEGEYRGLSPFSQFPKRYIGTDENDSNKIDLVCRKDFIKLLKLLYITTPFIFFFRLSSQCRNSLHSFYFSVSSYYLKVLV